MSTFIASLRHLMLNRQTTRCAAPELSARQRSPNKAPPAKHMNAPAGTNALQAEHIVSPRSDEQEWTR